MNELRVFQYLILIIIACCSFQAVAQSSVRDGILEFEVGNYERAIEILEPLEKEGNIRAKYLLALIHDPGFHDPPFGLYREVIGYDREAEKLVRKRYQEAAESGSGYAYFRLAEYHRSYVLLRQNYGKANGYLKKSLPLLLDEARNGDWLAAFMYRRACEYLNIRQPELENAYDIILDSAESGNRLAQFYMGIAHLHWASSGNNHQRLQDAFAWFAVAGVNGSHHAKYYLKRMMPEMSKQVLQPAKEKAANYIEKYKSK